MAALDKAALDKLLDIIGGDKASLAELVESFLAEGPNLVDQIKQASEQNDLVLLGRASHTLKSSALDFGATELSSLCATLESQCRQESVDDAPRQVAGIATEFDEVRPALEKLAAELKA